MFVKNVPQGPLNDSANDVRDKMKVSWLARSGQGLS